MRWKPEQYALSSRYRLLKDRSDEARQEHTRQSQEWRRELAEAAFPPKQRAALLELIRGGVRPVQAAKQVGVTIQAIYGMARWNSEFSRQLDAATEEACVCDGDVEQRFDGRKRCYCPTARQHRREETRRLRSRV